MGRGTMNRRLVNLVVDKLCSRRPAFKLHCIDPATLFHPTGSPPKPAADPAPGRLPPATISFDSMPCKRHPNGWMDFMAFNNNNYIIAVDHEGRTLLYDSASRAVQAMPAMKPALRSYNMFVDVGDGLYAMASETGLSSRLTWFHALTYGPPPDFFSQEGFYWRPLQLPCFDGYEDDDAADHRLPYFDDYDSDDDAAAAAAAAWDGTNSNESPHPCAICAFTVVGDSQIWVSTLGAGTYSFDIVSGKWSKVGMWALPFRGRAVYLPEHGLWFGISREDDNQLCAADLAPQTPPVLLKVGEGDLWAPPPPPACSLTASHLLPLGSGKLCVARLFQSVHSDEEDESFVQKDESFAVLTGVEVRRDAAGIGDLRMSNHKSTRYSFGEDHVNLIL